jgi:hypothetical protein
MVFLLELLNNSKVLNPCGFSINAHKTKTKKFPQNLIKSWDVTPHRPISFTMYVTIVPCDRHSVAPQHLYEYSFQA